MAATTTNGSAGSQTASSPADQPEAISTGSGRSTGSDATNTGKTP